MKMGDRIRMTFGVLELKKTYMVLHAEKDVVQGAQESLQVHRIKQEVYGDRTVGFVYFAPHFNPLDYQSLPIIDKNTDAGGIPCIAIVVPVPPRRSLESMLRLFIRTTDLEFFTTLEAAERFIERCLAERGTGGNETAPEDADAEYRPS